MDKKRVQHFKDRRNGNNLIYVIVIISFLYLSYIITSFLLADYETQLNIISKLTSSIQVISIGYFSLIGAVTGTINIVGGIYRYGSNLFLSIGFLIYSILASLFLDFTSSFGGYGQNDNMTIVIKWTFISVIATFFLTTFYIVLIVRIILNKKLEE